MTWPLIITLGVVIAMVVIGKWWMNGAGPDITQGEFQKRMKDPDYLLLDVRSPGEYASGHLPAARNVPITALSNHLDDLQRHKDKDVIVYCQHGPRARMAQRKLIGAGFSNVLHLEGDMTQWRDRGLPVEVPSER